MKKYIKPTLEIVQIRVKENLANDGNTTIYNMTDASEDSYAMDIFELKSY